MAGHTVRTSVAIAVLVAAGQLAFAQDSRRAIADLPAIATAVAEYYLRTERSSVGDWLLDPRSLPEIAGSPAAAVAMRERIVSTLRVDTAALAEGPGCTATNRFACASPPDKRILSIDAIRVTDGAGAVAASIWTPHRAGNTWSLMSREDVLAIERQPDGRWKVTSLIFQKGH